MMRDTDAIDQERRSRGADLAAELRDAISFPPLPPSPAEVGDLVLQTREHVQALGWGNREQLYTASQVRAVMAECAAMAAARERERWQRIAKAAQAVTTGSVDRLTHFKVPEQLMASLALALDEGPNVRANLTKGAADD